MTPTPSRDDHIHRIRLLLQQIATDLQRHPSHQDRGKAGIRLKWYWQIGHAVDKVLEAELKTYGGDAMIRLVRDVGKAANWLYAYRRFYRYYRPAERDEAIKLGLSWRHIQALLSLKKGTALRNHMQKKAVEEGWSGKEMARQVRETVRALGSAVNAREEIQRRSGLLDKRLLRAAATRCKSLEKWLEDLRGAVTGTSALGRDRRAELIEQVGRTAEDIEQLQEKILGALAEIRGRD